MKRTRTRERGAGGTVLTVLLLAVLTLAAGAVARQGDEEAKPDVDTARAALEKWVETRQVIAKERRDWALGKELLADRIDLLGREIESLREKIANAEKSIADADRKRAELIDQNEELKKASTSLAEIVSTLEKRTVALLTRLPDPIRERVQPLSQRIPQDPAETKLSLGKRFENVVGVLNEVNKFNGEVGMFSEVRDLGGGSSAEVTSVYVGVGVAFYVTADGKSAGYGTSNAEGWTWNAVNDAAQQIAKAIAILNNEEPAAFVPVPVRVDEGGPLQ